ncbi:AlpA family transcriptional regulator [Caulobacter sp. CCH9-E1]|jgi:prophage regulatory protein|uniref:helix-turn-helix transcriptional regulator n=1 Tax=Caulobacter sp. CCH9-E1 TaxID=1768768 RepID=UPI0008375FC2|nr:AlpA family phage regulatory protein [Caulobacter sp. CCH9-E1]
MSATASPTPQRHPDSMPLRAIRRGQLRQIVPLADTTIYEMERRGEFPRRFALTRRCVVWDLAEVEAWLAERKREGEAGVQDRAPAPDVRDRKTRPVRREVGGPDRR